MKLLNLFLFFSLLGMATSALSSEDLDEPNDENYVNVPDQSYEVGDNDLLLNSPGGGGGGWRRGGHGGGWGSGRTWYKPWTWFGVPPVQPVVVPTQPVEPFVGGGGNAEIDELNQRIKKLEHLLGKPKTDEAGEPLPPTGQTE